MQISFNWLKTYIEDKVELNELVEILTNTGLEVSSVEKVESVKGGLEGLVVGEVLEVAKHPNADRLQVTKVKVSDEEPLSIVCGAPNVKKGQKVVVAPVGCTIHPLEGDPFKIKKGKIRGEVSMGMICAEDEIGLGRDHDGIMVLNAKAKVGTALKEELKIEEDYSIEIDLTPNRTDAISHLGVARDYIAVKNLEIGAKVQKVKVPDVSKFEIDDRALEMDVEVQDKAACPRYTGVTMTEVEVKESPEWLKNRLKAIGLNPINNIVDAANFVMYETGQPMHVFDADHITTEKVVIAKQPSGTAFVTLDETERKLDENDLMINNGKEPMCIAGVFGGLSSGVKDQTKNIFIESAYFSPSGIRKTARRHGLSTDASYRYERGANPDATIYALKRLALIIKDVAGGKVSCDIIDEYPFKIEATELSIRFDYLNKIAGKVLHKDDVRKILNSLDFDLMMESGDTLKLRVPGFRTDVRREIDVVEEVLRIYGYNNIDFPEKMSTSISERQGEGVRLKQRSAAFLSSNGFREIMNNSLTSSSIYGEDKELVHMKNPLSGELDVMRKSMLYGGLQSIQYNINRKSDDLKFFEFGKVYSKSSDGFVEKQKMCLWITGLSEGEHWNTEEKRVNLYDLKDVAESLILSLGIKLAKLKVGELEGENVGYGLNYALNDNSLMQIYQVDSDVLSDFDIDKEVFAAEIDIDLLLKQLKKKKVVFQELAKYPSMRRDLALMLDDSVSYQTVENIASKNGTGLLRDINLFDVYKGKGIADGKKSYGVSFTFRDDKKTLTDQQVDKIMEKLISKYKEELKAELR